MKMQWLIRAKTAVAAITTSDRRLISESARWFTAVPQAYQNYKEQIMIPIDICKASFNVCTQGLAKDVSTFLNWSVELPAQVPVFLPKYPIVGRKGYSWSCQALQVSSSTHPNLGLYNLAISSYTTILISEYLPYRSAEIMAGIPCYWCRDERVPMVFWRLGLFASFVGKRRATRPSVLGEI